MIDDEMQAGYDAVIDGDESEACRLWLQTWRKILRIIDDEQMTGIAEFDERFRGTQLVFNWLSDFEEALHNAGRDNREFLQERALFCRTFIERFPELDDLMTENFRRSLADALRQLGDVAGADGLYSEWLAQDPQWGWGWIGWSDDHYLFAPDGQADGERAVELLRQGLRVPGVRDRADMLDRLANLYEDLGRSQDAEAINVELRELEKSNARPMLEIRTRKPGATLPVDFVDSWTLRRETDEYEDDQRVSGGSSARRIGRNEPCPCGSGKKYKKCCMQRNA
jgi:tetratricopeptide (TPR) repeat protein